MTLVFTDPIFKAHETGPHPETPRRLAAIEKVLLNATKEIEVAGGNEGDESWITEVHSPSQLTAAAELSARGGGHLDADTVLSQQSFAVAKIAAGSAVAAVDGVMGGAHRNSLCLVRPPGHHATSDRSMGFCIFNNVAIAAQYAMKKHGLQRILIVDWDVHHGNGTQEIFYNSDAVTFFSIHRHPFYPGTGTEHETGSGKGLGHTINVPVAYGTTRAQYFDLFRQGLDKAASLAKPELVMISAGFDAHGDDPIGDLGLQTEDFGMLTDLVCEVANAYAKGRVVSCLEGGYNLSALAASVDVHLKQLINAGQ
jgi:acetoin utilization deacetylase AcuC-like enzyme